MGGGGVELLLGAAAAAAGAGADAGADAGEESDPPGMEFSFASNTANRISNSVTREETLLIFFSIVSEKELRNIVVCTTNWFTKSSVV